MTDEVVSSTMLECRYCGHRHTINGRPTDDTVETCPACTHPEPRYDVAGVMVE